MTQMEREEEQLERELEEGQITQKQYNEAMRDMRRAYQAAAEEAAQDAYDREMEKW